MNTNINSNGVYISWVHFQRRSESVAKTYQLPIKYFHFPWEEKSKALKAFSYVLKSAHTFFYLLKTRPRFVMVQLAPTPPIVCGGAILATNQGKVYF